MLLHLLIAVCISILSFWGNTTFFKLTVNHVKDVICHQISLGLTAVVAESCVCGDLWMLLPRYPAKRDELNEERNESWMSRKRSRGPLPPCATTLLEAIIKGDTLISSRLCSEPDLSEK